MWFFPAFSFELRPELQHRWSDFRELSDVWQVFEPELYKIAEKLLRLDDRL